MGRILSYNRRDIASKRLKFLFYEIVPIFLMIFIILIFEWILLPLLINQISALFGLFLYLIRAIMIFFVIILYLFVLNKYKTNNAPLPNKEFKLHLGHLKLYTMNKQNYIYQLLYSGLLFFLILIPLEFIIIISLPEIISYRAFSLFFQIGNSFLELDNIALFLFFSIVIQLSISFTEESIYRGLIVKRGGEHFNKMSAVMISTFSFVFLELYFNSIFFPIFTIGIVWVVKSFIIGLVFSLTIVRKKWLFPLIFAKTIDSIISSVVIWDFLRGGSFDSLLLVIYIPLLTISLILLVLQRSRIKESLQIGKKLIKTYYQNDTKLKETSGDKVFRLIFDVFIAFLLFLFGILISI